MGVRASLHGQQGSVWAAHINDNVIVGIDTEDGVAQTVMLTLEEGLRFADQLEAQLAEADGNRPNDN